LIRGIDLFKFLNDITKVKLSSYGMVLNLLEK